MSKKISSLPEYSGVLPDASFVPIITDGSTYKYKLPDITNGVESSIGGLSSDIAAKQDDIFSLGYIKMQGNTPSFGSSDYFLWADGGVLYFKNSSGTVYTVNLTQVV